VHAALCDAGCELVVLWRGAPGDASVTLEGAVDLLLQILWEASVSL